MNLAEHIRARLVDDWRHAKHWASIWWTGAGVILSAFAFALSLSAAGMQFLAVFGVHGALLICLLIFLGAFIGRLWKQRPPKTLASEPDDDNAEHA